MDAVKSFATSKILTFNTAIIFQKYCLVHFSHLDKVKKV
ncbi:hypothetical protein [Acinetobacter bereziniae]|nr:hypothetical protein [Acinetobacter bereziniae]